MNLHSITQLMFETPNSGGSGGTGGTGAGGNGAAGASSTPSSSAPATAQSSLEKASTLLESASSTGSTGAAATGAGITKPAGTTGDATSTSAAAAAAAAARTTSGEAPESRIQAAVANARREVMERVGWAENLNREEVSDALEMLHDLYQNPKDFMARLAQEMGNSEPEPDPEPDLVSADGKIRAYSNAAVKKLLTNLENRLTQRFSSEFKPAVDYTQTAQARERVQQRVQQAQQLGRQALTEARKLPHFTENEEHISAKLAEMDPNYRRQVGSIAALHMAYSAVMAERVLPTLQQTTENKVLAGFQKSATASSGSIDPSSGTGGKPPIKDGDVNALARRMEELSAG